MSRKAFMPAILRRIAPRLGARVVLEPEHGFVGAIYFRNGRKSLFWDNKFNLNPVSSVKIAQDKGYTHFFLEEGGFRVPRELTVFAPAFQRHVPQRRGLAAAARFAKSLGYPVFVKALRRSQGEMVYRAQDRAELWSRLRDVFRQDRMAIVQETCRGRDYRLVVLDDEVISAYERVPLAITGDGKRTIRQLLAAKQSLFIKAGRDTIIPWKDARLQRALTEQALTWRSVIAAEQVVTLLEVANLSLGGDTIDVTAELHPTVAQLAAAVSRHMGLRFAGVDVMMADATRPLGDYRILEVNSAPGLDHYAYAGRRQRELVDGLYLKVLEAVERGPGDGR